MCQCRGIDWHRFGWRKQDSHRTACHRGRGRAQGIRLKPQMCHLWLFIRWEKIGKLHFRKNLAAHAVNSNNSLALVFNSSNGNYSFRKQLIHALDNGLVIAFFALQRSALNIPGNNEKLVWRSRWLRSKELLRIAFDVFSCLIHSTMSVNWSFGVKLLVALFLSLRASIAPDFLALQSQCWADAIEAVACGWGTWISGKAKMHAIVAVPVAFSIPLAPVPHGLPFFL